MRALAEPEERRQKGDETIEKIKTRRDDIARLTMRAWPDARSIFDAPYVREANERTTSWIIARLNVLAWPAARSAVLWDSRGAQRDETKTSDDRPEDTKNNFSTEH